MASYWIVFRLIFVVFSLTLLGDVFYRWNGFRYHSTFSEFLPNVALITVIWTIMAAFTATLIWLLLKMLEWFCQSRGWKVKLEHGLLFIGTYVFLGAGSWIGKILILQDKLVTLHFKMVVFLCVTLIAIFLTWLFRNNMNIIQERITPLVWIFGICVVISIPVVAYHAWGRQAYDTDIIVSKKISQSTFVKKDRPNIILIIFDAMTAWDMSVYGYHRPTTPFISQWAKKASVFKRTEAESNWTTATVASLMTGKRVWSHRIFNIGATKIYKGNVENLPLVMKKNGYFNMAFIVNPYASVDTLGISQSFDIAPSETELSRPNHLLGWKFGVINVKLYELFGKKFQLYDWVIKQDFIFGRLLRVILFKMFPISQTEVPPEILFNKFIDVINKKPPEPYFAWIHVYPPHAPYLPPQSYMKMFDSSSKLVTFKSQNKIEGNYFPQEMQLTINTLRARYDEFIRYCDKQFENFILQLTEMDKLKNTVIILSSDHGESFEHNYLKHSGPHLYEQVTHIPFIIKEPQQTNGQIINDLVEQIDIPPTILGIANIPVPSWMEGRSLVPLLRGRKLSPKHVFSMNFQNNPTRGHRIVKGTIAVWYGNYKLIEYLQERKTLLFNLKEDPRELRNLYNKEHDIGQHLFAIIQYNLKKANERIRTEK